MLKYMLIMLLQKSEKGTRKSQQQREIRWIFRVQKLEIADVELCSSLYQ